MGEFPISYSSGSWAGLYVLNAVKVNKFKGLLLRIYYYEFTN